MSEEEKREACEECDFKGWCHWNEPFEIERCDNCGFLEDDEAAAVAHARDCGCDWPAMDYQSAFCSWLNSGIHWHLPPELATKYRLAQELGHDRENFANNLEQLMDLVGGLVHGSLLTDAPNKDHWVNEVLRQMRGAGSILLNVAHLKKNGQWRDYWLGDAHDGTFDDKTGRWHPPVEGGTHGQG